MADAQAIQRMLTQLNDRVVQLEQQNAVLIRANQVLEQRTTDLTSRLARQETHGPGTDTRGGLFDKRLQEPEKLKDTKDFKEWSEEFLDFMHMCDEDVHALLVAATREKVQITTLGQTQTLIDKARPVFRMLKRYIEHKTARQVVTLAPGKNPYEAWRVLHQRYFPNNDASAGALIEKIMEHKHWKCRTIGEVPMAIQAWEKMQAEYRQQYHLEPLNEITRKHILRKILPEEVTNFLEVQTMLREDLSYEQIKDCCNNMAQKVAKVAIPMDLTPLDENGQPLDSFGKGPANGWKPGKGEGKGFGGAKGGGGDTMGKGKGAETRTCHNCGIAGHIAKNCRKKKSEKGKGKGANKVGRVDRAQDGKFYRRTGPGINDFE